MENRYIEHSNERLFNQFSGRNGFICLLALLLTIQLIVSNGSYSGYKTPPMYGDFEAQRHWMEITYNLSPKQWYTNSSVNDLNYWGLDYPPLTAYHSWLLGYISGKINHSWVELSSSQGIESDSHKFFMRLSVLFSYWLIYIPSMVLAMKSINNREISLLEYALALMYPGLITIDNGHFQYNHVSLGFFLFSFSCFMNNYLKAGSIFFVLAVNYKQMELYHALPIAVFLLSKSSEDACNLVSSWATRTTKLFTLFLFVVGTSFVVWLPLIIDDADLNQVIHRIFPFQRGLFEDKVANFWCALNVLIKLKQLYKIEFLACTSTLAVIVTNIPCLVVLYKRPTPSNFKFALFSSSLSFFLFSFQVHEKSILLVAIPAILLWREYPIMVSWFLVITNVSMYPLCVKDGNAIHLVLFVFFYLIVSVKFCRMRFAKRLIVDGSCILSLILCMASLFVQVPERYPHLFPLLNALFAFIHFGMFFVYINLYKLVSKSKTS